jgi:hypothetical protein
LFQLGTCEFLLNVLRPSGVGCDEWQIDLEFLCGGECDLGFFAFLFDPLDGVGLLAKGRCQSRF